MRGGEYMFRNHNKEKNNSLALGLLLGAAAGVVGVLMTDKKNREKVSQKMDQMKQWSATTSQDIKSKADAGKDDMQKSLEDVKVRAERKAKIAKDDLSSEIEETKQDPKKSLN